MTALTSKNRVLVYDIEANGFLNEADKIWCLYFIDIDTGEGFLFHDFIGFCGITGVDDEGKTYTIPNKSGSVKDGVLFAHRAKGLIAHNQLGYDLFLMKKFYPKYKIRYGYPEIRDTFLESQVQWYDRPPVKGYKGVHGLAVWGARLGVRKPEIEDWTTFDAAKLNRCIQDVEINKRVAQYLEWERSEILEHCGLDFTEALTWEHEYRYYSTIQELNGALVDVPHMEKCLVELDKKLEKLRAILEPELPPTVKIKGTKVSKRELLKAMGYKYKHIAETREAKERNGELKEFVIKDWYKPTTKWTNVKKGKLYGINDGDRVLNEPMFPKLKEARDYAKEAYPNVKKFTYPNIETSVEEFDSNTKKHFKEELDNIEIVGEFTKISVEASKMSQHEKIKLYLVGLGWQTDEWTFEEDGNKRADESGVTYWPKTPYMGKRLKVEYKAGERIPSTPKVSEDSFLTLPEGVGEDIKLYNTYSHRRKFIKNPKKDDKGLLNNVREDGRITCGINTFGTTAGRASHNNWVNPPSGDVTFGKEIREIIVAPEGSKLIGIDMPSAHPRLLADFTQNEKFIKSVDGHEKNEETGEYIGEDYHTVNSILFKLNTEEAVQKARKTQDQDLIKKLGKGRKKGKGGSYATIYGGGGPKIALTLGLPVHEGEELKQGFLAGLGLDLLLQEIEQGWLDRKWPINQETHYKNGRPKNVKSFISVLAGYHIHCASKHKIINYKALGSEAALQKVAVVLINRKLRSKGLNAKQIVNMHDEVLFEVPEEELDATKPIIENIYKDAAKHLGLTLDWSSSAEVGINYYECH